MRRAAGLPLAAAAALAATGCGAADAPGPPQVVRVGAGAGAARDVATGVVVGDGRVLTVAHALPAGGAPVDVTLPGGATRRARVAARSDRLDLALLAVGGLRARRPAAGAAAHAGAAATVWVLRDGRPEALHTTIRRTITARVRTLDGATRVRPGLELGAPIAKGDSGAPVVDGDGRLVGLAFARSRTSSISYAVAATAAAGLR